MDPSFGNVPPEVLAAYMQQLTQEQEDADLQHQLALAEEMLNPGQRQYGPMGSAFQAVADILNTQTGNRRSADIGAKRDKLRGDMQSGRDAIAQWWLRSQQPPPPAGPPNDGIPPMLRRPPEQMQQDDPLNVGVFPVPPPTRW